MADKQQYRSLAELTTLDDFLDEEGIRAELTLHAVKRVLAMLGGERKSGSSTVGIRYRRRRSRILGS